MHDTGCLGLVHCDAPEGWYGEGGGFRMGNTCIPVADIWQNQYNIVKLKNKKKRNTNVKITMHGLLIRNGVSQNMTESCLKY